MGKHLVPAAMISAMLAFAVAALGAGISLSRPGWWQAVVSLAVLGGVTPMIYAVNIRIVPVFARRPWPSELRLRWQMALAVAGAWLVFGAGIAGWDMLRIAGSALALGGGIVFMANALLLFRQPVVLPAPPLPYPDQSVVDRIATRFMRLAGASLAFGLAVGLATAIWNPETGRWELVWAHALLVGFFLSMASGVCYHVMPRWTERRWRAVAPIRVHFALVVLALPLMLIALATDRQALFAIAGPLQALAIGLFLLNCAPLVVGLPQPTRAAVSGGMLLLAVGVTLGGLFALNPSLGARLRLVHAEINLFGWTGLLISGAGYYLVPRFAAQPLRWPRLAFVQLSVLGGGVALAAATLTWRAYGGGPMWLVVVAQTLVAAGFVLFGVQIADVFLRRRCGIVAVPSLAPRPMAGSMTIRQR
jgi:hypothetical protein